MTDPYSLTDRLGATLVEVERVFDKVLPQLNLAQSALDAEASALLNAMLRQVRETVASFKRIRGPLATVPDDLLPLVDRMANALKRHRAHMPYGFSGIPHGLREEADAVLAEWETGPEPPPRTLTDEQREILIQGLVEEFKDTEARDDEWIEETLRDGRVGFTDYSDDELREAYEYVCRESVDVALARRDAGPREGVKCGP